MNRRLGSWLREGCALAFCALAALGVGPRAPSAARAQHVRATSAAQDSSARASSAANAAAERWHARQSLLAAVRWPLPLHDDVTWLAAPDDVSIEPASILLGARLWHTRAEAAFSARAGCRVALPFAGMRPIDLARSRFELALGPAGRDLGPDARARRTLRLRLEGVDISAAGAMRLRTAGKPKPAAQGRGDLSPVERQLRVELASLGIARGPALRVVFENLDDFVDAEHTRAFLWNELAARFREAASAKVIDPGPGRRGRQGLLLGPRRTPKPRRFDTRLWRDRPRAIGLLQRTTNGKLTPSKLAKSGYDGRAQPREAAIHARLIERFVEGLRWPLAPTRATTFFRADDRWSRHGLEEHRALDIGAGNWSPERGFLAWPTGALIKPPHAACASAQRQLVRAPSDSAWVLDFAEGDYVLRVVVAAYHLQHAPARPALDSEDSGKGQRLALRGVHGAKHAAGWSSADPLWRALGYPKSNHLHLEVLGIFEGAEARQREFFERHLPTALLERAREAAKARPEAALVPLPRLDAATRTLDALLTKAARKMPRIPGLGPNGELRSAWQASREWTAARGGFEHRLARHAGLELHCWLGPADAKTAVDAPGPHDARRSPDRRTTARLAPGRLRLDYRLTGPRGVRADSAELPEPRLILEIGRRFLSPLATGSWSQ